MNKSAVKPILEVENLSVSFGSGVGQKEVLHNLYFQVYPNEILGIVGESGSGKSVTSLALMGLLPKKTAAITQGTVFFENINLANLTNEAFRQIRGNEISMIFQEPMSSLNPSMTCGKQVVEILKIHTNLSNEAAKKQTIGLFEKVKLPRPEMLYNAYPHQISGGQKQRVMIAMALACKPKILIADEPTTALDVTVQKEIILLLKGIQKETGMSILFVSHDLTLVSEIANRILVMYQGKIVEQGDTENIFRQPKELYTRALLEVRPKTSFRLKRLPTIADFKNNTISKTEITTSDRKTMHEKMYAQTPLLEVIDLEKTYFSKTGVFGKSISFKAVDGVSFKVYEGETLGLVGESGCGKSTLGNAITRLEPASSGKILYRGQDLTKLSESDMRKLRKDIQIIFQDPYASLNPRIRVGDAIMEPMKVHALFASDVERRQKTIEILEKVGLDESFFNRYPHEFSGGQRQRIGIARTIALSPKLIICDESVSALDISVQAQVLNLLNDLKSAFGFTYIFISHDLAVVKYMSDQLMVMRDGKIEEIGDADEIYFHPKKEYTQKLIAAIPKAL
ncbi:MAG: ABC transporter ATP-binding protein [Flavobacteriales bacterium CG_4_9_14_3_um_filter_40_17]|nr:MAG: ABC transporter ATP-binding protein [Flavobacteriales bacterium CG_4_9_14_3_um_filter_40_17]